MKDDSYIVVIMDSGSVWMCIQTSILCNK